MKADNVLATIGNTPHIRLARLFPDHEVWVKSERANPGGSIKDRIALAMVEDAEKFGALKPGGTIIEPTSGNTGIGLAISASNELGEFRAGLMAGVLGAVGAVAFGGVGAILVTAIWAVIFPELRRARTFAPTFLHTDQSKEPVT